MRFIRDIIFEKRGAKPGAGPAWPEGDKADAFAEPARAEHARAEPQDLSQARPSGRDAAAASQSLFAEEDGEDARLLDVDLDDVSRTEERLRNQAGPDPTPDGLLVLGQDDRPDDADDDAAEDNAFADDFDDAARADHDDAASEIPDPRPQAPSVAATRPASPFDRLVPHDPEHGDAELRKPVEKPVQPSQNDAHLRMAMTAAAQRAAAMAPAAPPRQASEAARPRGLDDMPFVTARQPDQPEVRAPAGQIQVPPPAAGRGSDRSGRVKTRLLGFNPDSLGLSDPFQKAGSPASQTFPVAWLVVVTGPGRGAAFALHDGVSRIGRGEDQTVSLNFGDNSISRENHVAVAYDAEQNAFFIGQSGRANIVRLNNKPLLSTEQLRSGDQVRVGETTLRFVALCGDDFTWTEHSGTDARHG